MLPKINPLLVPVSIKNEIPPPASKPCLVKSETTLLPDVEIISVLEISKFPYPTKNDITGLIDELGKRKILFIDPTLNK